MAVLRINPTKQTSPLGFRKSTRLELGCSFLPSPQFTGIHRVASEYTFAMVSDAESASHSGALR